MPDMSVTATPPPAMDPLAGPQPMIPQQPQPDMPGVSVPQNPGFVPSASSNIENYAAAVHHSRLANALNAVGNILGGEKTLRLQQNPDGTVDVKQVDATRGEKWGRVAQAALSGAATGFAVGQGPGGAARAAAASTMQGMAAPQAQKDKTLAEAEKSNDQNMKRQLFNANMAMMHQQLIKSTFDNQTSKIKFGQESTQFAVNLKKQLNDMGASAATSYKTPGELYAAINGNQQLVDAHTGNNGMAIPVPDYDSEGNVTGGTIYTIPEDKRHQLNDVPIDIPFTKTVTENGKTTTQTVNQHIDKGQMDWEHIIAAQMGALQQGNNATQAATQLTELQAKGAREEAMQPFEQKAKTAQTAAANASATESIAGAHLKDVQAQELPEQVAQKKQANNATLNMLENKYVSPARETEKSWQMANNIYNEHQALKKQGKDFPTGAESMLMMSRHMQTTFGQVKGGRVTKDMIAEHFGARSVSDDLQTAFKKLYNGDKLSDSQWTAFHKLIGESRQQSWQTVIDAADSRGVDATKYLPQDLGGNKPSTLLSPQPGGPEPAPGGGAPAGGGWDALPKAN